MSAGRYAEAIPTFERLISSGEAGDFDYDMAYDARLFTVFSYDSLATCHFKLGHYADSRRYFELAANCEPDKLEYRVKSALCSRLERLNSGRAVTTSPESRATAAARSEE